MSRLRAGLGLAALVALLLGAPAAAAQGQGAAVSFEPRQIDSWFALPHPKSWALIVEVRIDSHTALAMVDSTTPNTVIDLAYARKQRMPMQVLQAAQTEEEVDIEGALTRSFAMGAMRSSDVAFPAFDLSAAAKAIGQPVVMVIGADLLRDVALELNFDTGRLRVRPSGSAPPEGESLPVGVAGQSWLPFVTLEIGKARLTRTAVSTSAGPGLTVSAAAWGRLPLDEVRVTTLRWGTSGDADEIRSFARFPMRLGTLDIGPTEAVDSEIPPAISEFGADAVLAIVTLRPRYNLFFDPGAGVLVLSPRARPEEPPPIAKIGVQGKTTDDGFRIEHVMAGSPGEDAGLRDGETVCTVNGERLRASWVGTPKDDWGKGADGTPVVLGMCNGKKVTVVLREFY